MKLTPIVKGLAIAGFAVIDQPVSMGGSRGKRSDPLPLKQANDAPL